MGINIGTELSNVGKIWPDVLGAYLNKYSNKLSASDIARKINLERRTVSRVLLKLVNLNLLKYDLHGKNKLFYLDLDNPKSKILLEIAENKKAIEFYLSNTKIFLIIKDLSKFCSSVIIFGSYASGKNRKDSDLDLVIFGCRDKKKIKQIKKNYSIEINEHYVSFSEFGGLLKRKQALSLEILSNHLIFGNVSGVVDIFRRRSNE